MSNSFTKSLLIILLAAFSGGIILAQPKDNSPFSQFGIGDYFDTSMPSSFSMGGLHAVYHDFFEANLENPASLGFLQYTTLQIGLFAKKSAYDRLGTKQNVWSGNLDHLSLNIPLINPLNEALERRESDFAWGTSFSIRPYSQVGYHIQIRDELEGDSIGEILRDFTGAGGLYHFTWGNGWKYKNLSVGLNLAYLYGKQAFDERITFLDLENAYDDIFTSTIAYRGVQYRLGVQYEHPLDLKQARAKEDNPTRFLSFGAFYNGKSNFKTKSDITKLGFNSITNDIDTAFMSLGTEREGTLPNTWGIGMMLRRAGDFRVGFDFQGAGWSEYANEARPSTLKDTKRFAFGAAWIPDQNSITSYFKRAEYRAGFYTKTDPRVIDGEQVKEYAVSIGGSFPLILQRNIAWFQLGFDVGGRKAGDKLSENFVRGKAGIIFNDNAWFIRGKYK